jgi:transposase
LSYTNRAVRVYQQGILLNTLYTGGLPTRGRKLTVDEKHTAEALHAHYKQERNLHIAKRFQALCLLSRGIPTRQVARIVGVSRMSIHKWLTWYRTGGLDELTRCTRRGSRAMPRSRLTPNQQARLIQHASTQGFRTLREAVVWCREALGVALSERPMGRLFHRLGFRRKVPRPMVVRADAALQAQCGGFARR